MDGWSFFTWISGTNRTSSGELSWLFCLTGLSSMDYWLGDTHLFPHIIHEYHTEKIIRLPRCFIAWQPTDALPDGRILSVPSFRDNSASGVRFGSFNNNRKFSNEVLQCWSNILNKVVDSKLVLKATNGKDYKTMNLLRQRLVFNGIDPSRVLWLERTDTPEEHLMQYSQIDIALDTFPNGGCTTTCESLWMGVPTIVFTGGAYVSRMSTAVLQGAHLPSLCATSVDDYIQIALDLASNVNWLRSHRDHWRTSLQNNPLGDSSSLLQSIETQLSHLVYN